MDGLKPVLNDREESVIMEAQRSPGVPTCPKCGKLISPKKYKRHIDRCGKSHKHGTRPLRTSGDDFYMKL